MQPEKFLEVAKSWVEIASSCEGHQRSLISRAYYASYHVSKRLAYTLRLEFEAGSAHEQLISTLRKHKMPELRKLGNQLNELKHLRVRADYYLDSQIHAHDIKKSINLAGKIVESCSCQLKSQATS